jgi:hypothetical protein
MDSLELFGMGFSWGGYESLIVPSSAQRKAALFKSDGQFSHSRGARKRERSDGRSGEGIRKVAMSGCLLREFAICPIAEFGVSAI